MIRQIGKFISLYSFIYWMFSTSFDHASSSEKISLRRKFSLKVFMSRCATKKSNKKWTGDITNRFLKGKLYLWYSSVFSRPLHDICCNKPIFWFIITDLYLKTAQCPRDRANLYIYIYIYIMKGISPQLNLNVALLVYSMRADNITI